MEQALDGMVAVLVVLLVAAVVGGAIITRSIRKDK